MDKKYDSALVDKLQGELSEAYQFLKHKDNEFRLMQRQRDWCLQLLQFVLGTLDHEDSGFSATLETLAVIGRVKPEVEKLINLRRNEKGDPDFGGAPSYHWLSDEEIDLGRFTNGISEDTKTDSPEVAIEGGEGTSIEDAVVMIGPSSRVAIAAQNSWIAKNHPNWEKCGQDLLSVKDRLYDKISYTTEQGTQEIYFDITDCFG